MKIGIIGAGNVGVALGTRLAAAGHELVVSFARTPDKVQQAAREIGDGARAGEPDEAVRHGDVIILATPWAATLDVVCTLASVLAGKVLWDTTNPLKADMSGLEVGTDTSGGELIQAAAPDARVVKGVPPFAELMRSPSTDIGGRRPAVFVCGDDAAARQDVLQLVADLDADGVDAGPLTNARYAEPLGMMLVQLAYVQGLGPRIAASLLR